MAVRKVVHIDEELCDGCGVCVPSCHEGALKVIDGKAKLLGDILCDGLGDCLGECPQGAITVKERDAGDFDEEAVKVHLAKREASEVLPPAPAAHGHAHTPGTGCPGSRVMQFNNDSNEACRPCHC